MEKMTYNERVRLIAEEMASSYNADRTWSSYIRWKERREEAEIAVAKMAEEFRNGWQCGYNWGIDRDGEYCITCQQSLLEYGLISDKTESNV